MPLDFPTSPTNGQTYNGYVYSTSVGAWQAKPNAQSPFYTSDTPPGNPVVGDSWFNTNDGTMYIYTYDGNSYQWVEHRSQIAKSQVGFVPITPTSVTVGSGTATISGNTVTFTGANTVSLNGIFTSAFRNYHLIYTGAVAAGTTFGVRLRNAGTDYSASTYYYAAWRMWSNGSYDNYSGNAGNIQWCAFTTSAQNNNLSVHIDVNTPAITGDTGIFTRSAGYDGTIVATHNANGLIHNDQTGDGFSFITSGAINQTGTVQIYGYN